MRSADRLDRGSDLLRRPNRCETQFNRQRARYSLEILDRLRVPRRLWVPYDSDPRKRWDRLLKQLQPLGAELRKHDREPRDVSAGLREILDQAGSDGIRDDSHDDRDRRGGALG